MGKLTYLSGTVIDRPTDPVNTLGSILIVEDDPDSISSNVEFIYEIFPKANIELVKYRDIGEQKIQEEHFALTIIDARIPASIAETATKLEGVLISDNLNSGNLIPANTNMNHVILTEHKGAIVPTIENNDRFLGIIEKGREHLHTFENKVITRLFSMATITTQ